MVKKILLIITGSVAAYKSVELIRVLKKKSFDVVCILTKSGQEFITPLLLSSVSQNKTYSDLFLNEDVDGMAHIKLSRNSDLIIVAPATADFIAKIANGYADDLASCAVLAADKKIIIAPAMNEKMLENSQTQKNLENLSKAGISILEPALDTLACGEFGVGKMCDPLEILAKIEDFFLNQNKLKGKKILITGGATFEPIDSVRFIGNHSSGKQAISLIKILSEMGAEITFVSANISGKIPLEEAKIIRVKTTDEMFLEVKNKIAENDVFIGCAAVSDYKIKNPFSSKIKKENQENLNLELVQNVDILEFVGNSKDRPSIVVGFCAESENLVEYGKTKLRKKNLDLIIANDVDGGKIFGSDEAIVTIIFQDKTIDLGRTTKDKVAKKIAEFLCDWDNKI
jgi:phosphopantothenoylcysteine decarboxylase/phosphopantothenate--cysteine ligase